MSAGNGATAWGRPLGTAERFVWLVDLAEPFHFHLWAEVEGEVDDAALRTALDAAQRRHPMLRAAIVSDGKGAARFVAAPHPVPLRVADVPVERRHAELQADLHARVPAFPGPGARCALLRHGPGRATLVITFHHAFADARGALGVMGALLRALAPGAEAGEAPAADFPAPMEAHLPAHARGLRGAAAGAGGVLGVEAFRARHGSPAFPAGSGTAAGGPRLVALSVDGTRALAARARREGATVHGALLAATALASAEAEPVGGRAWALTASPVDLRGELGLAPELLEFCQGMVLVPLAAGPGAEFWEVARQARGRLSAARAAGHHLTVTAGGARLALALSGGGGGDAGRARRVAGAMYRGWLRTPALGVSNLGAVDGALRDGGRRVAAAGFAATLSGLADLASFAATVGDTLAWSFVARGGLYAPGQAEAFAGRAREILLHAFAPPRPARAAGPHPQPEAPCPT